MKNIFKKISFEYALLAFSLLLLAGLIILTVGYVFGVTELQFIPAEKVFGYFVLTVVFLGLCGFQDFS